MTSDQCLGCHSAGGTGLQFDMTPPGPDDKLINMSPYGTWKGSPMGLAGRDPSSSRSSRARRDLASGGRREDRGYLPRLPRHRGSAPAAIDPELTGKTCQPFPRVDACGCRPYPKDDPVSALAHYGALARDGISCARATRWCSARRTRRSTGTSRRTNAFRRAAGGQSGLHGFAETFTGSFFVGPPNELYGPFQDRRRSR